MEDSSEISSELLAINEEELLSSSGSGFEIPELGTFRRKDSSRKVDDEVGGEDEVGEATSSSLLLLLLLLLCCCSKNS